jgi:hypothetical protein
MKTTIHMTDIPNMDLKAVDKWIDTLTEEADTIEKQIVEAQAVRYEIGEWADPGWYEKANMAMKVRRRLVNRLQQRGRELRIGERQKAWEREQQGMQVVGSYEKCFVTAAKALLLEDVFENLNNAALGMMEVGK